MRTTPQLGLTLTRLAWVLCAQNAWIGMYQLMFGLITIPAAALPLTPHHLSLSSLPTYLKAANQCFFGYNVMKTDQCSGDGLPVIVFMFFIIFNVTYNQVHCLCCTMRLCRRGAVSSLSPAAPVVTHSRPVHAQLMLYVFKRGSSVLFVIASAVRLPLVDLLLLSTFIAGRAQERFTSTRCVPFVRSCVLRGSCCMGWPLTRRLFRGTPWPQFSTATPCSPLWFVTPSPVLPPAPLRKVASAVQLTCVSRRLHVPPQMAIVVYYSEKEAREEPDGSRGRVRTVSRTPKMTSPSYNVRGCACVHELGGRAHAWRAAQCCTARPSASRSVIHAPCLLYVCVWHVHNRPSASCVAPATGRRRAARSAVGVAAAATTTAASPPRPPRAGGGRKRRPWYLAAAVAATRQLRTAAAAGAGGGTLVGTPTTTSAPRSSPHLAH